MYDFHEVRICYIRAVRKLLLRFHFFFAIADEKLQLQLGRRSASSEGISENNVSCIGFDTRC